MHSNLYDHFHYVFFAISEGLGERHDNLKATQHLLVILPGYTTFLCKQSEGGCAHMCFGACWLGILDIGVNGGQNPLFAYYLI